MQRMKSMILVFLLSLNLITSVKVQIQDNEVASIWQHFQGKFKVGTSVSPNELNNMQHQQFIKHHFNAITPENELKPDQILDQQASIQWGGNVNPIVNFRQGTQTTLRFCQQNGIALRGHTFVWHSQTPGWLFKEGFQNWGANVSKDIMNKRLENFIKNTFDKLKKEYPNLQIYAYDVANEVFKNDGGGLRPESNWFQIYHDDSFIINAFIYARKYAPAGCQLFINDYNEYMPNKTNDLYNIAMKMKAMGIIDGIGMQSHLSVDFPSAQQYCGAMDRFASTGLMVHVTEADITNNDPNRQAGLFKEVFKCALNHNPNVHFVTVWGTNDGVSWRRDGHPLLFDANYQPKPSYWAIMSL